MQKHFVSRKNYRRLHESFSETEVDVRKTSFEINNASFADEFLQKCSIGDGAKNGAKKPLNKPSSPPEHSLQKAFAHMRVADEAKLDLRKLESYTPNVRSACKIYPIDEVSENSSRASSKMRVQQYQKKLEAQRVIESNKKCSNNRPTSRRPSKHVSAFLDEREVEIFRPVYTSEESVVGSAFAEHLESSPETSPERKSQARFEQLSSPFGSLASFKRAQFHRLSNDLLEFQNSYEYRRWKTKNYEDTNHELMSVRTYSTGSSGSASCFGCLVKPLTSFCRKKSSKR